MLPFLNNREKDKGVGLIITERKPDAIEGGEDDNAPLEACGADLLSAIEAKDPKAIAAVFKAAFEILESLPHHEGEHIPESEEI